MPKKTKEAKIIAGYRKKLKLLQQQTIVTRQPRQIVTINKPVNNSSDLPLKKYFFVDLKKSVILITLIITLEIVFYFVRIK